MGPLGVGSWTRPPPLPYMTITPPGVFPFKVGDNWSGRMKLIGLVVLILVLLALSPEITLMGGV